MATVKLLRNTAAFEACETLYLNEKFADVYFVFNGKGKTQKIPAHKLKLAVLSIVFRSMFFESSKEVIEVEISDVNIEAFKEFLQFFYLSEVTLTMENIMTVIRLAVKYDILEYVHACVKFVIKQLLLGVNKKDNKLIEVCGDIISTSPKGLFAADVLNLGDIRTR